MKTYTVLVIMLLVIVYACKHEVVKPPAAGNPDSTGTGTGGTGGGTGGGGTGGGTGGSGGGTGGGTGGGSNLVCFDSTILPIFTTNCAKSGCHNAASSQKGYVFDSYANIIRKDIKPGNADDSKVYKMIMEDDDDKVMPPPPNNRLTAAQKALIKRWIDEGAKNTACGTGSGGGTGGGGTGGGSTCNLTNITYSGTVKPVIDAKCVSCHSGTNPAGGLNYTTHAGLAAVATNGRLVGAINHAAGFEPMPRNAAKLDDCTIQQITKWVNEGAPNN